MKSDHALSYLLSGKFDEARQALGSANDPFASLARTFIEFLEAGITMEEDKLEQARQHLKDIPAVASNLSLPSEAGISQSLVSKALLIDTRMQESLLQVLDGSNMALIWSAIKFKQTHSETQQLYQTIFGTEIDPQKDTVHSIEKRLESMQIKSSNSSGWMRPFWSATVSTCTIDHRSDQYARYVIGTAACGQGVFLTLFSCLPPMLGKFASLIGFSSNRDLGMLLLEVAHRRGSVLHSSLAGLTILGFHTTLLQLSSWIDNRAQSLLSCDNVLKFDCSTKKHQIIWTAFQAKILRLNNKNRDAIILVERILPQCQAGPIEVLLRFELGFAYLEAGRFGDAINCYERLLAISNWAKATYLMLLLGCHLKMPHSTQHTKAIVDILTVRMPKQIGSHVVAGKRAPSEKLAENKLAFWNRERETPSRAVHVSPLYEVSVFWNLFSFASSEYCSRCIQDLHSLKEDCLTAEEKACKDLLLGILHRRLGQLSQSEQHFVQSEQHLDLAIAAREAFHKAYAYVKPYALFEKANLILLWAESSNKLNSATLDKAEDALKLISTFSHYDMHTRLEMRMLVLRTEMRRRRQKLRG